MDVMVLAPHQDDEVLGCGGTIARLTRLGHKVLICSLGLKVFDHKPTDVEKYREQAKDAAELLGASIAFDNFETEIFDRSWRELMVAIAQYVEINKPDVVFIPFDGDLHQDHRATSMAARFSLRGFDHVSTRSKYSPYKVLMYQVLGSTGHNFTEPFLPNVFIPLSDVDTLKKLKALAIYDTEARISHPRDSEVVTCSMRVHGAAIGTKWAEAFQLYRETFEVGPNR